MDKEITSREQSFFAKIAKIIVRLIVGSPFHSILSGELPLQQELFSARPGNFYYSLSLFMEIMVKLARFDDHVQPVEKARFMIGDAADFMNKNFRRPVSIDELARIAKMSKRNFFRYFKNAAGCTPLDYLLKIRLNHAANLLLQSDKSVNDIALECGFCDSNYFCRKFRAERAISPRRFRQGKQRES